MMIFLEILKWIGIVICIILALILMIVMMILFIPVRYKGSGYYNKDSHDFEVNVSWFFHIINLNIKLVDNKPVKTIRICGIQIGRDNSKSEQDRKD